MCHDITPAYALKDFSSPALLAQTLWEHNTLKMDKQRNLEHNIHCHSYMHSSPKVFQTCNHKFQNWIVIKVIKAKKKRGPLLDFPTSACVASLVWLYLCNYIIPQYQLKNIKFRSLSSKLSAALNQAQSSLPESIPNQEDHNAKKSKNKNQQDSLSGVLFLWILQKSALKIF